MLCLDRMYLHNFWDTVNKTGPNDLEIIFPMLATYPAYLILPDSIALIMPSNGASDGNANCGGTTFIHTFVTILNTHPQSFFFIWRDSPQWARASSFPRFLDHTQWRTTVGRIPLDEWSARRRDLYLATQNTNNRHTCTSLAGFEPTVSTDERPQTCTLDGAATGTGFHDLLEGINTEWQKVMYTMSCPFPIHQ